MILRPTVENYFWIKAIIDDELEKGKSLDEYTLYKSLEHYFTTFMQELSVEQSLELLNKAMPFLSDIYKDYLLEIIFEQVKYGCWKNIDGDKIEIIVKHELLAKIGVSVEKCSIYKDDKTDRVRIYGILICNDWDDQFKMEIAANVYNYNNEIIDIIHDNECKDFYKIGYETFFIEYSIDESLNIKYFELYPKIRKVN